MNITYDPKPLTAVQLHTLSEDVKRALAELYGERLDRVILYGSYARGDFHAESDVDYLAVLRDDYFRQTAEFDRYWDITWNLWEQYGIWISVKPVFIDQFSRSELFFYQNARKEGRIV